MASKLIARNVCKRQHEEEIEPNDSIYLDLAKGDERRMQRRLVDAVREPANIERGLGRLWPESPDECGLHCERERGKKERAGEREEREGREQREQREQREKRKEEVMPRESEDDGEEEDERNTSHTHRFSRLSDERQLLIPATNSTFLNCEIFDGLIKF